MLVDTSVWVDHFRRGRADLQERLERGEVFTHPFVVGELACGNLRARAEILSRLSALPSAPIASHDEALALVEAHRLHGAGLGWVDVHLLAAARLASVPLWTLDRVLDRVARSIGASSRD